MLKSNLTPKLSKKIDMLDFYFYELSQSECTKSLVVAKYMKLLAKEALKSGIFSNETDLTEDNIEIMGYVARWYGIGRSQADDLDDADSYPVLGRKIIDEISGEDIKTQWEDSFWCIAMDCCLEHRERFDGEGYPYGTGGNEISIVGRICAICNDLYLLISNSTSRQPFLNAFQRIKSGAGKAYDPQLISLLENVQLDIENIPVPVSVLCERKVFDD